MERRTEGLTNWQTKQTHRSMDVLADGCTKKYAGVYSQENGKMTIFFIFTQNCCCMPIHGKSWVRIFFFDLLSTQDRPRIDLEGCTEIPTSLFVNPEGQHPWPFIDCHFKDKSFQIFFDLSFCAWVAHIPSHEQPIFPPEWPLYPPEYDEAFTT